MVIYSIPVNQKLYNQNNHGLFVPACNSHDICYGCQGGNSTYDKRFHSNMKNICKNWKDNDMFCNGEADVFYAAVSIDAKKNYDACKKKNETLKTYAYCGTSIIQNTLLHTPYYVQ